MPVALSPRTARNIAWMEKHLRIPDGDKAGQRFVVPDYIREDLELLWGNPHGTRTLIVSRPRKNLKTFEIALVFMCALIGPECEPNSQLYSVANSQKQAMMVCNYMCQMIRFNPRLKDALTILHGGRIEHRARGVIYQALSSRPETAHGKNPRYVCFDELGQWKAEESELFSAMTSGSILQGDPVFFIISTQAPNDFALLSQLISKAQESTALPDGHPDKDPQTVVRLDTAPTDLDPDDPETFAIANPAYREGIIKDAAVIKIIRDAKRSPVAKAQYRNLHLNQRVSTRDNFVSLDTWRANARPNDGDWRGCPVWCGLDLSTSLDLTAFVMMARVGDEWQVRTYCWLPEEGLEEKGKRDSASWSTWADMGVLLTTPGSTVNYEIVAQRIYDLCVGLDVRAIACDVHRLADMRLSLIRAGFTEEQLEGEKRIFVIHKQDFGHMSSALNALESMLVRAEIAHGSHPILSYCAYNALVRTDSNEQRKLVKKYSSHGGRIDAMVALAMAANLANQQFETVKKRKSYLSAPGAKLIVA